MSHYAAVTPTRNVLLLMMRAYSRRHFVRLIAPLLTGLSSRARALNAQHLDLQIFTADQSKSTGMIVDALRLRFPSASVTSQVVKRPAGRQVLYLSIGPEALRYIVTAAPGSAVISLFTSYKVFHSFVDKLPGRAGNISAIYADPAPLQQLQLIALIYKKPVKIGVVISTTNDQIITVLKNGAVPRQVEITYEALLPDEDVTRALTKLRHVQAILALPDSVIYNSSSIRTILVSTYRRNQAVIGFSSAVVKAGALATTYSGIDDIVAQVDEILGEYDSAGNLPEPRFPKYFETIVNDDVARSLNIVISPEASAFARRPIR
jgi:hypothetical protein